MMDEEKPTIDEDIVVTKYKMAAEITNKTLEAVATKCVVGASVRDICMFGDQLIIEEASKHFKKTKDVKKGIAFPTCISVNNCICNFSPLMSEPDRVLVDEDVCKIDLGAHIDGYIALVAHTIVVGATLSKKITGRKADTILAAHYASEAALRLVKPGNESDKVVEAVQKIADSYNCRPVIGTVSGQIFQDNMEGDKAFVLNPTEEHRRDYEKFTFERHEVYDVDVLISTGTGQGQEAVTRTSVFKRNEVQYMLKLKSSRAFFSEVQSKYGMMAFNLRDFQDEVKAKLGVLECVKHEIMDPFGVKYERHGEIIAQFRFTVLLMPSGSHKITGLPFDAAQFESDHSVTDESLVKLLATAVNPSKKKKKNVVAAIENAENVITESDVDPLSDSLSCVDLANSL